jgi:hypothetical protein
VSLVCQSRDDVVGGVELPVGFQVFQHQLALTGLVPVDFVVHDRLSSENKIETEFQNYNGMSISYGI